MLKFILAFLVLANGTLYAYHAGFLGAATADGREPARLANQLEAQRIVLVVPTAATPSAASETVAPATVVAPGTGAGTATVAATPVAGSASTAAALEAQQCIEIGNFDTSEARRFDAQLAPLALGQRVSRRNLQENERFIVYIPPLPDKESAERKAGELRRLGIDDFYIFGDTSDLRLGVSLGMFKTAEAANQHLANLARKGVRSARVTARGTPTGKSSYQLRGLDAAAQATLARIRSNFPAQLTRACAPA